MYGNTAANFHNGYPLTSTWPGQTQYNDTFVVYYRRSNYTYGNEPTRAEIDKFAKLVETVLERRRRISKKQKLLACARLRKFGLPALPEAQYDKPTFVRRACGSRWRVMTP